MRTIAIKSDVRTVRRRDVPSSYQGCCSIYVVPFSRSGFVHVATNPTQILAIDNIINVFNYEVWISTGVAFAVTIISFAFLLSLSNGNLSRKQV